MKTLSAWVFLILVLFPNATYAAAATLSLNAGSIVTSFVPSQVFGVNTIHFNFLADHQAVQAPLQAAGMNFLRYPGGSYSDVYHWNSTGNYVANIWTPNNSSFSPGFTSKAINIGTSASGISALTDGLTTTAWVSNPDTDFPSAQWVYVDLVSQQSVNQVQIWWSAPYATTFQVQYWDPAASNQWAPYLDTAPHWLNTSAGSSVGSAGQQTTNFTTVSTRYLRVLLQASSAPGGGYAINELKVFNSGTQVTTNINSGSQSQTTASSTTVTSAKTGPTAMGFDDFMVYCNSFTPAATPLITVNVGTGTPQEAAAWVHYANVVKGYNIKHWEIGNEMMGNWEPGGPLQAGDYGRRFIEYYNAMIAEDPSIKLVGPVSGPTDAADNWTSHTYIQDFAARLSSAGMGLALGGVSVHVYAGYQNDTDAALLPTPANWVGWAASINSAIAGLPSPGTLPVILSEYNANSSATNITVRLVNSLWVVNWLGQYLQAFGSRAWANFFALVGDGAELTSNSAGSFGLFDGAPGPYQYQPFASYWGLQMMAADWAIAGDTRGHSLVSCTSSAAALVGYADLRPDGVLALIVINQDNINSYIGTVQMAGFTPMASATTYSYSSANYQWQAGAVPYHASPNLPPTQAVLGGISTNFNYNFSAYSLTVFQFQPILTPSPSPTGGPITPTSTPTLTPSFSQTLTPTPAPTACVSKVAYNGELGAGNVNLASGNFYVTGGSTAAVEDAASLHGGAKGLDISYNWNSYWANFTFNWANYSPGNAYNLSTYDTVEFWVRCASGSLDYLYLGLDDSSGGSSPIGSVAVNSYLGRGVNTTWQRVAIPLSAFTGINKSSLWAFDLYISGLHSGSVQVYVDDFVFLQHCSSPTASPSATNTMTATASPSSSITPTPSPTVTSFTTMLGTATDTLTSTGTPTVTGTSTPTLTPTSTSTMGLSSMPSPSVSATFSATFADPSEGPLVIMDFLPLPNPNPKSFAIKLQSYCDGLSLKLYSPALTLVVALKSGPQSAGWQRWDLPQGWDQALISGLYFGVVEAKRGSTVSPRTVIRLLISK